MKFEIFTSQNVYRPGDVVSGQISITFKKDVKLRLCEVNFKGSANVHWTEETIRETRDWDYNSETYRPTRTTVTETFEARQVFFQDHQVLLKKGTENKVLDAGNHTFPFIFRLQGDLPTSFEGDHGWIRYMLEAVIDESWWKSKKRCSRLITVTRPVDCNANPMLLNPLERGSKIHVCCFFCPLNVYSTFEIQRQAYCAGESIVNSGEVRNTSFCDVDILLQLYQVVKYKTTKKTRIDEKLVAQAERCSVASKSTYDWHQRSFQIPPVSPTITECDVITISYVLRIPPVLPTITECDVITISYVLRLCIDAPCTTRSHVNVPLLIGTIPANIIPQQPCFVGGHPQMEVVTQQPSAPPSAAEFYPQMPQPLYIAPVSGSVGTTENTYQENKGDTMYGWQIN